MHNAQVSVSGKVLVTGGAGFIGSHLVDSLLEDNWDVTVIDNFDPFYVETIKRTNIASHLIDERYRLVEVDIRDANALAKHLQSDYDVIVHLAARTGVRPSTEDPIGYHEFNVKGTQNILELARELGVRQVVFGSSSSVYGVNPNVPWREDDHVLRPISPYACTKISGELLGHVYSHLYGIRFIALRFFTVYGPRQRPDLAIHKFARLMLDNRPIPFYGDGQTRRDYTFVRDIVSGIRAAMTYDASEFEVVNLGNNQTVSLNELVSALEDAFGIEAIRTRLPPQPGDVPQTWADIDRAYRLLGYQPKTDLREGIAAFRSWMERSREIEKKTSKMKIS